MGMGMAPPPQGLQRLQTSARMEFQKTHSLATSCRLQSPTLLEILLPPLSSMVACITTLVCNFLGALWINLKKGSSFSQMPFVVTLATFLVTH